MTMRHKISSLLKRLCQILWQPLIAVILGFLLGSVVIMISGESPSHVYTQMFQKSFLSFYYLLQTLTRAVPITICSMGIIVAWRAGYINLGVEGQMIVGGLVSTVIAIHTSAPAFLVLILAIAGGMAAGALYALFAAFIYQKCNVSIVISTLMMNYIANYIASYFVTFPLKDPKSGIAVQSVEIPVDVRIPRVFEGHTFNWGFLITILIVAAVYFVIGKTIFGYESKMTGLNPVFANYGGVKKNKVMMSAMAFSGALAACAGMLEIFGVKYRYIDAMFISTSYAWTGLMSGLISSLHPAGAFAASIFLSGLQVGGQAIQRTTNIPLQVSTLIQSTITLFVSVKLFTDFKHRKKQKAEAGDIINGH